MDLNNIWGMDIETYPNIFTCCLINVGTGEERLYEISDRVDHSVELHQFFVWMAQNDQYMVGYNNVGFDYPVLHHFMLHPNCGYLGLYMKANAIIQSENRFANRIWDSDMKIPQIDLFLIHHFDNQARSTSLKMLEYNMKSDEIEDLPYEPGTFLDNIQEDVLCKYNKKDVRETIKFLQHSIPQIEFREKLSEKYGRNFMNHNDTKIGKDYFIMELEKRLPGSCYTRDLKGKRVPNQTVRAFIDLDDCVFDYVNFSRPEFKAVADWMRSQKITKTKGVFNSIHVSPEMARHMNYDLIKVKGLTASDKESLGLKRVRAEPKLSQCPHLLDQMGLYPNITLVSGTEKDAGLNCVVDGFEYVFGTGGIHGSVPSSIVSSDDYYVVIDADVASYYPNLAIANRLYPAHLGEEFCDIYLDVYNQRKQYPKKTHFTENLMLKLALNGVYGDSNNPYSPFYDPHYTMSITLNGQLLLCMLSEWLAEVPELRMVQINTDGLTVKLPRHHLDQYHAICKRWEEFTKLELEFVEYKRMMIRDVNSYIAEKVDGGLKLKGAYDHICVEDGGELGWHQNRSSLVVQKAAEAALVYGMDIDSFIRNHPIDYDFTLRTKVKRSDHLMIEYAVDDTELQRITRYYVANHGGILKKISPPVKGRKVGEWCRKSGISEHYFNEVMREIRGNPNQSMDVDIEGVPHDPRIHTKNRSKYSQRVTKMESGWQVRTCNSWSEFDRSAVNYDYYINEAKKLVVPLLNGKSV